VNDIGEWPGTMVWVGTTHGRPVVVMSVAVPFAPKKVQWEIKIQRGDVPLAQVSWVPAFQSLLSRPKASKFQVASNATHGDARTAAGETKRVTKVSSEANMATEVVVMV